MAEYGKKLYDEKASGFLYSGAIAAFLLVSLLFGAGLSVAGVTFPEGADYPDWYRYCAYLLPQAAIILTLVAFFVFVDVKPKQVCRGAKAGYFLLAIALQFGLFSLSRANEAFISFLQEVFGYTVTSTGLPSLDGWNILPVILAVALLPAVVEETLFRGVMLLPMKKFSTPLAVLLSGALFALYHQNPAQTIYQFCCGCAFALVAVRAGSVFPTMLSHFLNNAVIIVLTACGIGDFTGIGGIVFYTLSGISLAAWLIFLLFIDKNGNEKKICSVRPFLFAAAAGIVACVLMWTVNLLAGMGVIA